MPAKQQCPGTRQRAQGFRQTRPAQYKPAYANLLTEQLRSDLHKLRGAGERITLWVIYGQTAWKTAAALNPGHAHHPAPMLVLPPAADPAAYDWRLAAKAGPPVLLHCAGPESQQGESERLAVELLRAGVRQVLRLSDGFTWMLRGAA